MATIGESGGPPWRANIREMRILDIGLTGLFVGDYARLFGRSMSAKSDKKQGKNERATHPGGPLLVSVDVSRFHLATSCFEILIKCTDFVLIYFVR